MGLIIDSLVLPGAKRVPWLSLTSVYLGLLGGLCTSLVLCGAEDFRV